MTIDLGTVTVSGLDVDEVSVLSTVDLHVAVTCLAPDGSQVDPTGGAVAFAILASGTRPTSGTTWLSGVWDVTGAGFSASVLIGPAGSGALVVGEYDVFIQLTDSPELIELPCGSVTFY